MPDIVDKKTRSEMMANIRGTNTRPELFVRKGLHARGFRFRLHAPELPGKPDICLPRYRAVIFVNGCFWHGHECHLFKLPGTRRDFWHRKIARTKERDRRARDELLSAGWRCMTVWECALKGKTALVPDCALDQLARWLKSDSADGQVYGEAIGSK